MGDLAIIESGRSIAHASNAEIWRASTDAASLCKEVVNKRAINLQGKRYVPVEGWQAIALAHGCVASAENVEFIEGGCRAEGVIRRIADGAEVARAEGFVGADEPVWFGGKTSSGKTLPKRPDFAIRAMAQTRGISRACRSAFAHVVVMMDIGLETTPFEEMNGVYDFEDRPARAQPKRARDMGGTTDDKRAKAEAWVEEHLTEIATTDDIHGLSERTARATAKLEKEHPDLFDKVVEALVARNEQEGGAGQEEEREAPPSDAPYQAKLDEIKAAIDECTSVKQLDKLEAEFDKHSAALPDKVEQGMRQRFDMMRTALKGD